MPDVIVKVKAEDAASGVFANVAKNLRTMQQESRREGEGALERALGSKQGAAGAVADYLGVGLQAIVVDQLGNAFKNVTEKAMEMRQQLAEGKVSTGDMVTEMAKGVPILGSFVDGWLNVRELVTGEKAEIAAINKETELTNTLMQLRVNHAKNVREEHEKTLEVLKRLNNESRLIGLAGEDLAREGLKQRKQKEVDAANSAFTRVQDRPEGPERIKARSDLNQERAKIEAGLERNRVNGDWDNKNFNTAEEFKEQSRLRLANIDLEIKATYVKNKEVEKAREDHLKTLAAIEATYTKEEAELNKKFAAQKAEEARKLQEEKEASDEKEVRARKEAMQKEAEAAALMFRLNVEMGAMGPQAIIEEAKAQTTKTKQTLSPLSIDSVWGNLVQNLQSPNLLISARGTGAAQRQQEEYERKNIEAAMRRERLLERIAEAVEDTEFSPALAGVN
jgi:hypothetical protein